MFCLSADMCVAPIWKPVTEGYSTLAQILSARSTLSCVLRLMQFGRNVFQRLLIGGINFDSQFLLLRGKLRRRDWSTKMDKWLWRSHVVCAI